MVPAMKMKCQSSYDAKVAMIKDAAMFKAPRPRMAAHMMLGTFWLLGCSAHRPVTAGQTGYTVNMPIARLAGDPRAKAVLVQDVPGVMANSKYPLYEDMSLAQLAIIASGKLPKAKLDEVQADLDKLGAPVVEP